MKKPYQPPQAPGDPPPAEPSHQPATIFQRFCFGISLLIAAGYGLAYWQCKIGVSPFAISRRLPQLDWLILGVTVIAPLVIGIAAGALAGKLKWFVLPIYPVVIALSLM